MKVLAIDAGNTRTKWGIHDGTRWRARSVLATARVAEFGVDFARLLPYDSIVISNVAGAAVRAALRATLPRVAHVHWIKSQHSQCGVKNSYEKPGQLGSDRWAALIGARSRYAGPVMVVNAGTALTADALGADGTFLGGIIVPGVAVMRAALGERALALKRISMGRIERFPRTTADAVVTGSIYALTGAIERFGDSLEKRMSARPRYVLSGGDATLLAAQLNRTAQVVDNLVLEGLFAIACAGVR